MSKKVSSLMAGAEPFSYLSESSTVVLLFHGFEGSPFEVRALGKYLHKEGFAVEGPLLPGHGTTVTDLEGCTREDWACSVREAIQRLRKDHDHVLGVGFSMGGTLLLREQARANLLDAFVTINTPLFVGDWKIRLLPLARPFISYYPRRIAKDSKTEWVGYRDYYSLEGLSELTRLMKEARSGLSNVTCPVLVTQADQDPTVPQANASIIFEGLGSSLKEKEIFSSSHHLVTPHEGQDPIIWSRIKEFLSREFSTASS